MRIFIDEDYHCYTTEGEGRKEYNVNSPIFDGKCTKFVEGYRYIPPGESWTRSDGFVFQGEMISPWKDYSLLAAYQEAYEEAKAEVAVELEDKTAALNALGVFV